MPVLEEIKHIDKPDIISDTLEPESSSEKTQNLPTDPGEHNQETSALEVNIRLICQENPPPMLDETKKRHVVDLQEAFTNIKWDTSINNV